MKITGLIQKMRSFLAIQKLTQQRLNWRWAEGLIAESNMILRLMVDPYQIDEGWLMTAEELAALEQQLVQ